MEPKPEEPSFKLNSFYLRLTYNDAQLIITAEQKVTLKHFKIIITPDNLKELTSFIFRDLEAMYLDLLDALEGKAAGVKLSLSYDARLTYTLERVVRGKKFVEEFTLDLVEEQTNELKRQERRIDKLLEKIAQQGGKIVALEKENSALKSMMEQEILKRLEKVEKMLLPEGRETAQKPPQKVEAASTPKSQVIENNKIPQIKSDAEKIVLERPENNEKQSQKIEKIDLGKRVGPPQIEKPIEEKIDLGKRVGHAQIEKPIEEKIKLEKSKEFTLEFDPTCTFADKYSFSEGNKTVTYQGGPGAWSGCILKTPLPKKQKTKFSLKVDNTVSLGIMIGICPSAIKNQPTLHSKPGVYCFSGYGQGRVYVNGKASQLSNAGLKNDHVMTVTVDLSSNVITFEVNGTLAHTGNLDPSLINSDEYYPFVEMYGQSSQVSLI